MKQWQCPGNCGDCLRCEPVRSVPVTVLPHHGLLTLSTVYHHSLHGPFDNSSERRSIQIFQMSRILLQNFNILPLKVGSCEVGVPVLSRNEVTGILIRTGATEQLSLSLSEKQFPVWAPQIVEVRGEDWGPAHTFLIIICRLDFSSLLLPITIMTHRAPQQGLLL